jgi:DNA-binding SARP family transcriptional activator
MVEGVAEESSRRLAAPRIAVLGPVACGPPGQLRPLGGRPGRVLIALAAASRPCSLEALADAVWGADRPPSYRPALHVHLGHVRRVLAELDGGAGVLRSPDGYALATGACELDASLATDLLDEAHAREADDPAAGLTLVDAALALWRGTPFASEGEVIAPSARHHLEAVHRDAVELRVELLLLAGEARSAEAAANDAVESEPLREHRWGQLLRARYLAGRTADALATYQDARRALVEALGIEPGPELRDLEAAVLTHDVARLRLPVPPPETLPPLPTPSGELVGRDEELRRAATTIASTRRLVVLGPPGVGKSRFAVELARLVDDDGAWVDVATGVDATAVLDWARRHPDGVVVADGAEHDLGAVTDLVGALARSAPGVSVLATSRKPVGGELAVEVLGPLTLPSPAAAADEIEGAPAVLALRTALRELAPAIAPTSTEVAALARRAGGLPLALRLAAAAARTLPVATILERPASGPDDAVDRATRAVLDLVDPATLEAFSDLAVVGGTFDLDLAGGVTDLGPVRMAEVVVDLADHGLVQARPEQPEPYSMLEPLRAVGDRLLVAAGRRDDVLDRHAQTCLERARGLAIEASYAESTNLGARLDADLPRHREAIEHLARRRDAESALTLVCHLDWPLYALGRWEEKVELFDRALAIPGRPSAMRARAHALRARPGPLHLIDLDHVEQADAMAAALGHDSLRAFARFVRALRLIWEGRSGEAAELFHGAQQVFEREGHGFLACDARKFFGVSLVLDGDADLGLDVQREALAVVRRDHPSPFHAAHSLAYLGHCHRFLGDDAAALANWTEGRALVGRLRNQATAVHISIGLGELAVERGDVEGALALTAEALDLAATGHAWAYEPWAWTLAIRANLAAADLGATIASARRAVAGIERVPSGEAVRLGVDLAALALAADDPVAAARLLGVVGAMPDRRELPFPPPGEADRRAELADAVRDRLGDEATRHLDAGARCSLAEAAGPLLAA